MYTGPVSAKGSQESGHEGESTVQPDLPAYTGPVSAKGSQEVGHEGESTVQPDLPAYTGPVSAKGSQEVGHEGESTVQPDLPAYSGPVSAKGSQESGHEGESTVQPDLPEYHVSESTVTESETVSVPYTREYVNDDSRYTDEETIIQKGEAGSQVIHRVYKTVEGQKVGEAISTNTETIKVPTVERVSRGTKAIEGHISETSFEEIPFKTTTEFDSTIARGTEVVSQVGKNGKKKITKTYKTIKGVKTAEAPVVSEEIVEQVQDRIIKKGAKALEKPTLTLTKVDKQELDRSAAASYTLNKPEGVTIKSIRAVLKKGNQLVKTLDIPENQLSTILENLDYYKGYTLTTTMIYDRGNGDETETLVEQPIQLDLKKIELKDIQRTDLIKYDSANKLETDETRLTSVPTDLSPYYLKVTSNDHKTNLLAVKKIEETTVDGKQVYKVTAVADNLVQRKADNHFSDEYTYYIEKSKEHDGDVYYDFADLIKAMQANPLGNFKLGQSMSALHVPPVVNSKSYVSSEFKGTITSNGDKRYAIYDLERPLFDVMNNATVEGVNLEKVQIKLAGQDNIASIARVMKGSSTIKDVKVTGSVTGKNNVSGLVNSMEQGTKMTNVAFLGKIHSSGWNSVSGGIAGRLYQAIVEKAYVDATITGNKVQASSLVPQVDHGMNSWLSGTTSILTKSVAKGTIDVVNANKVGAISSKTWPWGTVKDNVSYVDVKNGEMLFGSDDVQDEYAAPQIDKLYSVENYSKGQKSYNKYPQKFIQLTEAEAAEKVKSYGITADTFESEPLVIDQLNQVTNKEKAYQTIQDYNPAYQLAYENLEKLQPFYNKDYIVYQANTLAKDHNLNTKEILSVTPMQDQNFVTDLSTANKLLVHYADGSKETFALTASNEGLTNVREYELTGLGIKYSPNIVQKNQDDLINGIVAVLSPIDLQSDAIYQQLGKTGNNRANAVKDLYLEESFNDVKANLQSLVTKLVENEDHQLNDSTAAKQMILDKVEKNKAALLLGLTYLNRYYGVKFGDYNIKELMLFKPDFYGKNVDVLDRLIEIGSKESTVKGDRTYDAFGEVLAKSTRSGNLEEFFDYNRKLFTTFDNLNDWFIDATKNHVYIAERASEVEEIKTAKYRAFDNLKRSHLRKTLLPLLNLNKSHIFIASNYNALALGSAEKLGQTSLDAIKETVDKAADGYRNYYDFWYRLATDNVKKRLLRENVIPIWEGYNAPGGWVEKYGRYGQANVYSPLRELFGPIGKYYGYNGTGAYAMIYDNPNDIRTEVNYIHLNMVGDYGISVYTHETTHVNDTSIYLGGYGHREGTSSEAYAQGMLQTPVPGSGFNEYGSLGINMVFKKPNDGNQWYITDPKTLTSRAEIDHYMRGYNDALMLMDQLEADAVLAQNNQELNGAWFKKIDRKYRDAKNLNQWDQIRPLTNEEKTSLNLHSVDDLVDQELMTNRQIGNGVYKPEVISYNDQSPYVGVEMTAGIYGGNTSKGAPGAVSFKHNAFRLWGYYGYENGFLGYASNKYKQQSKKDGHDVLSDEYVIKQISGGRFSTIEDFKKAYFREVKTQAIHGLTTIEVDGHTVSSYQDLLNLFKDAVIKDAATLKADKDGNKSVTMNNTRKLKEVVYKKLLQQTDSFKTSIFK